MTVVEKIKQRNFKTVHERGGITFHPLGCQSLYRLFSSGIEKIIPGEDFGITLVIYDRDKTKVMVEWDSTNKLELKAFSLLMENPGLIVEYESIFRDKSSKFISFLKENTFELQDRSDKEILSLYDTIQRKYFDTCLYGEPFPFAVKEILENYLEKRLIKTGSKEYFLRLITPRKISFVSQEEMDLNKIVKKIKDNDMNLEGPVLKDIEEHQRRYFWLNYDYVGNVLTKDSLISRIEEKLDDRVKTKESDFLNVGDQEKIFKQLMDEKKITAKDKQMFLAAQDAITLLDVKKAKFSEVHYYINKLIKEIARRKNVDFWNLIFLKGDELDDFLKGKITEDRLRSRRRSSIYVLENYNAHCLLGDEKSEVLAHLSGDENATVDILGRTGSPGKVNGKVKVLNSPKELDKISKGDILVAGMTTPEYVPAMKKAGAVVTDEGGMTCHAAIVARELGIPCIIGTKKATSILKDGDLIEVDADKGRVTKYEI